MSSAEKKAKEYLKNAQYFHLGQLPTEASHPGTKKLAKLANQNLPEALRLLQKVDLDALQKLKLYLPQMISLKRAIQETFSSGGRVFLCGCGATGRLSLSLEFLWRLKNPRQSDSVVGFMAGGDVALVHSLEGFEDFPEYGAEHLMSLDFSENDLLISSTEGGETPYVIGATEKATQISKRKPFFLYCNPKESLVAQVERSRRVLQNPKIENICLEVGPMALSGSTRMQASTVLMLAIGICLFDYAEKELDSFIKFYSQKSLQKIEPFIKLESKIYQKKDRVLYSVEDLAMTVFTDTTERSPTFSLPPFGNKTQNTEDLSIAYLMIPSAQNTQESWQKLLLRSPRVLEWPERNIKTTMEYLEGFDFSRHVLEYRKKIIPQTTHHVFSIEHLGHAISFQFQDLCEEFVVPSSGDLFDHIFLKLILNTHSTLLMGRLGRYVSNFMTYVSPTNGKLIDRAARYALWLLEQDQIQGVTYEQVIHELFRQLETVPHGESVVVRTFEALRS